MTSSRLLAEWPDPYGIAPNASSRLTASPLPEQRPHKPSPVINPTKGSDTAVRVPHRSPLNDSLLPPATLIKSGSTEDPAYEAYRVARCKPLLQWWRSCVDDVSERHKSRELR